MRRTDAELAAIVAGTVPLTVTRESSLELIEEVLEAQPVAYKDGLYVAGSGLDVVCWCPDEHAQEPPTQVHLVHNLSSAIAKNARSIIRLKSGVGVDKLIAALYENRLHVWPSYKGVRITGVVFKKGGK